MILSVLLALSAFAGPQNLIRSGGAGGGTAGGGTVSAEGLCGIAFHTPLIYICHVGPKDCIVHAAGGMYCEERRKRK